VVWQARPLSGAAVGSLLCVLLGLSLLLPGTVAAHAELASSDPAANESLPEPPEQLTMTFTEPVDLVTARIALLDNRQAEVAGLGAISVNAAGTTATLPLPDLEPGIYTVSYQVTSATDGHVTAGIFAFLVDPTGTQPAPTLPSEATSPSSTPDVLAARWVALASALSLLGVALFWLFSARPALAKATDVSLAAPWGVLAFLAVGAAGGLALYLSLSARPIVEAGAHVGHGTGFPLDFAAPFGSTSFANAMRVALVGAAAAFVLATARFFATEEARRRGVSTPATHGEVGWLVAVLVLAAISLAGTSLAGHAASLGGPLFAAIDLGHLLGVAAWIGTLPGLLLLAFRARSALGDALRRHSQVAMVAAPIVVLTGLANSPMVMGNEARELVASGYGNLLLGKAFLFSAAGGLGAVNFFLVRSERFRRSLPLIGVELAIGVLAVVAAAGMVTGQPAATRASVLTTSAIGTAHLYGTAGESSVHVAVSLPSPGSARYQVAVADAATGADRTDVQRVILVFTPPAESGLPAGRVELEQAGEPWLWGTSGVYTPVVGTWQLEVVVRRLGELDESTSFELPVLLPLPPQRVPPPDTGFGVPMPLAALWAILPFGVLGWTIPLILLGLAAGLGVLDRRGGSRARTAVRAGVVLLAVVAGLGVASRAAVEAANQAPAAASGMANPQPATTDSILRGHHLYLANCAACHGVNGDGDGPTAAGWLPPLRPLGEEVPNLSDGALAYRIAVGSAGTRMPAFASTLSENDRWDLVNYLRTLWPLSLR
jgi:copper transport protein